ncbi:DUF6298 domain-containing protein [Chitinophaga horti]|uniref:DUF6298 domain-containing protein n=1 Tax=Chitinophaga horti TaxID=2920382 RepID=A0ABY6J7H3_9BACT|nr:DUF6298 domain-containing protein [Chitinophaga horti]UYQ95547.1 DUF6298 domain-containing protein [Chitinophaga horti]
MVRILSEWRRIGGLTLIAGCCLLQPVASYAQKKPKPIPPLSFANGKLQYAPDSLGNRIPDFSWCGYKAGETTIPDVPVKVTVPVKPGDATSRIQAAIDYVSRLPLSKEGWRGAVLLAAGDFEVTGSLSLHTSGVILRGSGSQTTLHATGKHRETVISILGKDDRVVQRAVEITDVYVPVNANRISLRDARVFKKGDQVIITRPCTAEWIAALGTDHFGGGIASLGWKPGQRTLNWVRTVTAADGQAVTFDAPVTTALSQAYGGATIAAFTWQGRVTNCGVENLQIVSAYDRNNPKDEDHRWMAIIIDNAADAWVRQVRFAHFAGSAVAVYGNASRVTVEDCISQQPVSEIGGERRNTFFTAGQQTLFQRCYAENGIHDFATGFCAPGPNAFVQCEAKQPYSFSGGIDSWSAGVLYDVVNVDGNAISLMNRGQDGQGAGWNNANSVLWNCSAARIDCYMPPTAQNWSFGSWSQFSGNGYWGESNNSIEPRSLYYAQLNERTGRTGDRELMEVPTEASSSPSVETAAKLAALAVTPANTLLQFISEAPSRHQIPITGDAKTIDQLSSIPDKRGQPKTSKLLQLQHGRLLAAKTLVTGSRQSVPWWNGSARPYALQKSAPALTRFVPGRTGTGLTDDLHAVADTMLARHVAAIEQNYGLWYDRRRDDHERIRRIDGDVWTPFYELPFARSGKDTAWDGLSKYDLTKYNDWYWRRLQQFAGLADEKGLVLVHQQYFQHNILEAGAHYADFPWRTANNINNVGFPEPVPYAGDKRIFMDEQFYDTAHAIRSQLHQSYIRQCLNNFAGNHNVIQLIGEEFTGPLHFVQFWLNIAAAWEKETGNDALIGLSTTKDVQDAILNDKRYAASVDVIDIRYWYYQADGSAYAPQGGQHLAPRQHARLLKPKSTSAQQVYRAVLEYTSRFPEKAVIYSANDWDKHGWAVLMAGGSLPAVKVKDEAFLQAAATMRPVNAEGQWILENVQTGLIVYPLSGNEVKADLSDYSGKFSVQWISSGSGEIKHVKQTAQGGKVASFTPPGGGNWVLWLKKV